MKRILLLVMLALTICTSCFAGEQDIVNSFKAFVNPKIAYIQESYDGTHPIVIYEKGTKYVEPYYAKQIEFFEYNIDVRETNSLVNPYVGIVELEKTDRTYLTKPTKEEALKQTAVWRDNVTKIKLLYKYDNGAWVIDKVTNFSLGRPHTYEIDDDEYYYDMVRGNNKWRDENGKMLP